MRISPYGLILLTMLVMGTPALVFAETENEANEGTNEISEKQSTAGAEREGNDNNSNSASSNVILFVTIAAIASVVGYSAWKVYKVRRRATSKSLV